MNHAVYLGASLAALPLGPMLDRVGSRARWLRPALDGFVLVMVGALVLLHVLPHALEEAGPWALAAAGLGLLLPAGLESLPNRKAGQARIWTMGLAVLGLSLHALMDGAALSTAHGPGDTLAFAVLVHRIPVGLFLWWSVGTRINRRAAAASLVLLGGATTLGFAFGTAFAHLGDPWVVGLLEALVGGSLLHVLADHGLQDPSGKPANKPTPIPEALGALTACVLLVVLPFAQVGEAAHEHASVGQRLLHLMLESAPALLVGYLLAGVMATQIPKATLRWAGRGGVLSQSARGVLFGLPIPVCSCGVVPVYKGLVKAGLPATAGMAFLVATPELGIESLLLSLPLLGGPLTALRLVAAALVAITVGVIVGRLVKTEQPADEVEDDAPRLSLGERARSIVRFGLQDVLQDTALWIMVGLMLAALLEPDLLTQLTSALPAGLDVPLAALAGLPVYVCASGATPLAAALIYGGVSPGAALAFLLAGPATNVTTFGVLTQLHGKKIAIALGLTVTISAVAIGFAVNGLWPPGLKTPMPQAGHEGASLLQWGCLAVLGVAFGRLVVLKGPRALMTSLFSPSAEAEPCETEDACCGHEHG